MRQTILAVVLFLGLALPTQAREFTGGVVIEIRECGRVLFVVGVTPEGKVWASPVWVDSEGRQVLDSKETVQGVIEAIVAATPKGQVGIFHIDRHKKIRCVEA